MHERATATYQLDPLQNSSMSHVQYAMRTSLMSISAIVMIDLSQQVNSSTTSN